ncbi:hypothetical protein [Roseovarius atlanticus]|uniref:hypothetical protein n=1 Tax=Roseovarius atlanticus TaxID=1641875 RepID=UPI001C970D1B|nr:hypothetical protein [Roseovarius atlanticus]MBY5987838.1 hypothetical protein [Roseovarius atlanticus]MBY6123229.1 hypothetical protein [Roseovarius atlanticus]MBY6147725.1 hypothetical protein [Roseovarius atlanticus]
MFNRTIALAAAFSTAGALAAYADSTVGEDVTNKGQVLENAAEVTDGKTTVETKTYSEDGDDIVVIGSQTSGSADEGVDDEVAQDETGSENTEGENILLIAEPGTKIFTVTGEPVGTVSYTEDSGEMGGLVFVDLDPEAGYQVPTVGIQVKSLQTTNQGKALEYAFSVDYLRDRIADALSRG